MKVRNTKWLNADFQAHTKPQSLTLIREVIEEVYEFNTIKINMQQDPAPSTFKKYELKVPTSESGKLEEFLQMMKKFKTATDGIETMSATGKIQFLSTMLCKEDLREFGYLAGQVGSTTNRNLRFIKKGLLRYFLPVNTLINQKRTMRCAMQKP